MGRKAARLLVLGEITGEHADRFETVGKLETDDGVVDLASDDLVEIILRPVDLAPVARQAGQASAKGNAGQFELFGECAALLV